MTCPAPHYAHAARQAVLRSLYAAIAHSTASNGNDGAERNRSAAMMLPGDGCVRLSSHATHCAASASSARTCRLRSASVRRWTTSCRSASHPSAGWTRRTCKAAAVRATTGSGRRMSASGRVSAGRQSPPRQIAVTSAGRHKAKALIQHDFKYNGINKIGVCRISDTWSG